MRLLTKRNLSIIFTDLVVWIVAMAIFVVLRFSPVFSGPEIAVSKSDIPFKYYLYFGMQIGVFLGMVYGIVDLFLDQNWLRKRSYGSILIIKGVIHFVVLILISVLIRVEAFDQFDIELTRENLRNSLINPGLIIILGYTTMVSFVLNFFRQINLKFGPGNLWKFITGRFHHPKEEERIFMFLDMKGSTTIAESLGHVQFGELVQDCFSDLSVVRNNEAEVYQYVGDEAILYWEVENGLRNNNCLLAFFEYNRLLKSKSEYYQKTYGVIPEFKAGANIGAVTVTEVGDIKRDLAFLGDTMNTAARIESECNKHNTNLLISEMLHQRLPASNGLLRTLVDQLTLRGKKQAIGVYSVAQQD